MADPAVYNPNTMLTNFQMLKAGPDREPRSQLNSSLSRGRFLTACLSPLDRRTSGAEQLEHHAPDLHAPTPRPSFIGPRHRVTT